MKRLHQAAVNFWSYLPEEIRTERVHETVLEILEREAKGETHKISWWAKWMYVRLHHKALRNAREIAVEDMAEYLPVAPAPQFDYAAACQAARLLRFLPELHATVMAKLADGANPLEISDETGMHITKVLDVIRDARKWLADGGSYLETEGHRR